MIRLLVVPAVLLAVSPAHAVPSPPLPYGACSYHVPTQDQQPFDEGRHWAVLSSDPIVVGAGLATVTCTVQVGTDWSHTGPDVVARTSPATAGVVALPPASVTFEVDSFFSYCTRVDYAGGATFYYDAQAGHWSTDPSVPCYTVEWGPPPQELPGLVSMLTNGFLGPYGDPYLCPALATAPALRDYADPVWIGPDGDLWVGGYPAWDC